VFIDQSDKFIADTVEIINKKPQSFEEITQSKAELTKVNESIVTYKKDYALILKMNEIFKQITNEYLKIDDFKSRWDNLINSIKNFDTLIDEQKN